MSFTTTTNLSAGDAAFVSYQEDGDETWSIVLMVDIEPGTVIVFTDNGWRADGGFRIGESEGKVFTATQAIEAGTVITFTNDDAVLAGTSISVGTMSGQDISLSNGGSNGRDQLFMYQGSFDTATGEVSSDFQFIAGYDANEGGWASDATDNLTSALPSELIDYNTDQSDFGEAGQEDNAVYVGPTEGTIDELWGFIRNELANWDLGQRDDSEPYASGFAALSDFTINNTPPEITLPSGLIFEVNSTGNAITGLAVSDLDDDTLTVTLTTEGTLTLSQTTGLSFTDGDGADDSTMTFSGSEADINAALDGMLYTPATNDDNGDTIDITVTDESLSISEGSFDAVVDPDTLDGSDGFRMEGLGAIDLLGYDVAGAGDVNGDGIDDFIIGAPYADTNGNLDAGEAYLVFGTDTGFPEDFDLSTLDGSNGVRITSSTASPTDPGDGDRVGHSVNALGDVNGDGIDDFAIGSFTADDGATTDAGKAWIVFGTDAGLPATLDVNSLDGTNGFFAAGLNDDDYVGRVVTSAGDINGDGIDDIMISADRSNPNGNDSGAIYIIYGTDSGFDVDSSGRFDLANLNGSDGTLITGTTAGDRAGRMVDAAGDVNGDGIDDLVIGAYEASPDGNEEAGRTYVVYGDTDGLGATLALSSIDGTNGISIDGVAGVDPLDAGSNGDQAGRGVSSAGDINGDGYQDILIGAPNADEAGTNSDSGAAYVVFGGPGLAANIDLSTLDGTNGFKLTGAPAGKELGFDVTDLGDINGDGIDDILIGGKGGGGVTDSAYVVFGSDAGFAATLDLSALDGSDGFEIPQASGGLQIGFAVAGAGDVNDDGINDLIVSDVRANGAAGSRTGEAYVIYGNAVISQTFVNGTANITHVYAPEIANLDGDAVTFTEGDALALLDAGADLTVSDNDSADFDGGVLDVQFTAGQLGEDTLLIDTSGSVALSAGQAAGSEVSVGGTVIGTIVAGETGASGEGLQIDLNADATPARVEALLGAIGYGNTAGDTPTGGARTLEINLSDGDAGTADAATVTVDVVPVDNAPTIAPPAAQSFAVNSTGNTITGLSVDDVDSSTVAVTLTVEGTLTLAQTTGLTFTAGADGTSTMTFEGTTADVNAAIATLTYDPASDDRDGDTLSITVDDGTTPVNDTVTIDLTNTDPVAADDAFDADEDGPVLSGDVFADNGAGTDSDANGDMLSVSEVNGQPANVGTQITLASGALLTLNADGTFDYDTNGAFENLDETQIALDSFVYTADDGFGGTDMATVTVTVQGANDASALTVPPAQSFAVNSSDNLLAGLAVSDADDTSVSVSLSAEGTISLAQTSGLTFISGSDGSSFMTMSGTIADINAAIATLTYTPMNGDRDGDTIGISVDDGIAVVNDVIAIGLDNTDPVGQDDEVSTGDTLAVSGNVLDDNGNGADSDANSDALSVSEVNGQAANVGAQISLASGALLTLNADGSFDYDPNGVFQSLIAGQTDTDSFTYTVDDGFGGTATATVNLSLIGSELGDDVAVLTGHDDTLSGGPGNDDLNGSAGNDTLFGNTGEDRLIGASGNDWLDGGTGNDFLGGGNGNDELFGGDGNDTLRGSGGDDRVLGQAGDDVLYGDAGADFLGGGNGDDELYGGDGNDTLQGAAGNDRLIGQNGEDTLFGGDGDDFMRGAADNDVLHGDAGDDELRGDNGEDQLFGGAGNDEMFGGAGNDILQGADGDDSLFGDSGDDVLMGGVGNDFLGGAAGNDELYGDDGNDDLRGAFGNDILDGGAGDDILQGNEGDDILGGGNGNDQLFGGSGADEMQGSEGDDLLGGGAGADILLGGIGNDDLRGGGGDDVLAGQDGDDILLGDMGTDTFVFAFAEPGNDTVIDFEAGETVRLDGFGYANEAEAAEDFTQVGGDVVFAIGNQSATFKNADRADVIAGIQLDGGSASKQSEKTAPASEDGASSKGTFDFTHMMIEAGTVYAALPEDALFKPAAPDWDGPWAFGRMTLDEGIEGIDAFAHHFIEADFGWMG